MIEIAMTMAPEGQHIWKWCMVNDGTRNTDCNGARRRRQPKMKRFVLLHKAKQRRENGRKGVNLKQHIFKSF
jgi:hypothetical protein